MTVIPCTKKGQIHMMETLLVLFMCMLLLLGGIYFYFTYSTSSLEQTAESLTEEEATVLLNTLINSAEFSCPGKKNCIDLIKVYAFLKMSRSHKEAYQGYWGNKKIVLGHLYPQPLEEHSCSLSDFEQTEFPFNCKETVLYEGGKGYGYLINSPVSLYYLEHYYIGVLSIYVY